ncbi:hypothetical protein RBQ61_02600 [Sedimentibacter sp. MB35-C1]|uniref:hypothetical protein n=1 Tax=Sedimentibacter sp. MB35-C1 TaxID=3070995 RepID=UPI0027E074B8|nr:hypothetical protein [Sedimentibacter sp. MB35-C1]WMJ77836.1 hypothetical protein RBQ61_02600 [Sedimentibacter sp. MB35-C1]
MKKKLFLLFITLFLLTGCSSNKIDLSQYANISISGYNGYGTASVKINWTELESELLQDDNNSSLETFTELAIIEDSIKYSIDKSENLTNGDTVNLTVNWNKDLAKKYKVSFTANNASVKVENLEEPKEVDLFTDIHIEYEGVSPNASALLRNASNDPFLKNIYYDLDNSYNISNGDTITVSANISKENAIRNGIIINNTEKEFTAEGLDEYITEYASIDTDTLEKMKSQANDLIESQIAGKYSYNSILYPDVFFPDVSRDSINIVENALKHAYFFTLKSGMDKGFNDVDNSIFLVYEIKFTSDITKENSQDVTYVPVYFKNIIKRSDGILDVNITDAYITNDASSNLDNVYRDTVTANKAKYNYEEIDF